MKRLLALIVCVAALAAAFSAFAGEGEHKGTVKTLTGELVDTGCYLGHEARGAKHVSCASKCIANGMPMGLLTADGTLYLITLDHENADPYNKLKDMAGKTVKLTGTVMARGGMKGIDVTAVSEMSAAVAK